MTVANRRIYFVHFINFGLLCPDFTVAIRRYTSLLSRASEDLPTMETRKSVDPDRRFFLLSSAIILPFISLAVG
jgi:hypothetical protein